MAHVVVKTNALFWFRCEGCGVTIVNKDLSLVAYETHDRCYTDDPDLRERAVASGVGDIYTFMADQIEVRGAVMTAVRIPDSGISNG